MTEYETAKGQPSPERSVTSVRVTTGSRLHFGLLDTRAPFGGAGVMIDQPMTEVIVCSSDRFVCEEPERSRLRGIATRIASHAKLPDLPPLRINVAHRAEAHCGLGSGTQLSLAAAEAMSRFVGLDFDPITLAESIAQRGRRSAVGVHGYFNGGLIYESADDGSAMNPIQRRIEIPESWTVALFRPDQPVPTVSGEREQQQFTRLPHVESTTAEMLQKEIVDDIIPAAARGDFTAFARAVSHYNETSGRLFQSIQGGVYNGPIVTQIVRWLVDNGAEGVGQSSWGPGVFVWFETRSDAEVFARRIPKTIRLIAITHPRNGPRTLLTQDSEHPGQ